MSDKWKAIPEPQGSGSLKFLYGTVPGRVALKLIYNPIFSKLGGSFMNSFLSRNMIQPFISKNNIDMTQFEEGPFRCYNDFFSRKIRESSRTFDLSADSLICPCDSKLAAYMMNENSVFCIKDGRYTAADLLQDEELAQIYRGGYCLIFRLTVDDYHRYCYIDNCTKTGNTFIKGKLHTVQPIAHRKFNIYKENSREYTVMDTEHFGRVTQVEVGALMVGKISNHHQAGTFKKGQEKGMFQFGGSTIVILLQKGVAHLDQEIISNTINGLETVVKIGEKIGTAI